MKNAWQFQDQSPKDQQRVDQPPWRNSLSRAKHRIGRNPTSLPLGSTSFSRSCRSQYQRLPVPKKPGDLELLYGYRLYSCCAAELHNNLSCSCMYGIIARADSSFLYNLLSRTPFASGHLYEHKVPPSLDKETGTSHHPQASIGPTPDIPACFDSRGRPKKATSYDPYLDTLRFSRPGTP